MIGAWIVAAIALFLLVKGCLKWGFTAAIKWTSLLCLELPVFWFVGLIVKGWLGKIGVRTPSPLAWIVIGVALVVVLRQVAKRAGWGKTLEGLFIAALCFSTIIAVLFCFLLMGAVIHATPQAMVFIAGTTVLIMAFGRTWRPRGQ
jgi:hypothetical protein